MVEDIPLIIIEEDNFDLLKPVEEEILKSIWELEPDKAPEPDGFSISSYRYYWSLINIDLKKCSNMRKKWVRLKVTQILRFLL